MDLRPTSNAAAAAKIGHPPGEVLAGRWRRCSSVTERLAMLPRRALPSAHQNFAHPFPVYEMGSTGKWNPQTASVQKKIRAAHARRNNKYEKTCSHPNRLNLSNLTGWESAVHIFCRIFVVFFGPRPAALGFASGPRVAAPIAARFRPGPPRRGLPGAAI